MNGIKRAHRFGEGTIYFILILFYVTHGSALLNPLWSDSNPNLYIRIDDLTMMSCVLIIKF